MKLFDIRSPAGAATPRALSISTPLGALNLRIEADADALAARPADEAVGTDAGGLVQGWSTPHGRLEILTTNFDAHAIWSQLTIPVTSAAFLIRMRFAQPVGVLRVRCGWETAEAAPEGGHDGGQGLMAATYEASDCRVSLGTEDGEALRFRAESNDGIGNRFASRLDAGGARESEVVYDPCTETTPTELVSRLLDHWPGDDLELVFEVAWATVADSMRDPETDECGTWYAVDTARSVIIAPHAEIQWLPGGPLPERIIDGAAFSTLDEFYDEVERALIPGTSWGRSLDAFNDILRGGFGTPDEGFVLIWQESILSRQRLAYEETVRVLQARLETCHPSNRESVAADVSEAAHGRGPTVFDILVEIIRDHGPEGEQAEDNVLLRLE